MAVLFGVGLLVFLVGFAGIFSDINPAFGVPNIFFDIPAAMDGLMQIPKVLAVLSVIMLIFSVFAWVFQYWSKKARVYYHVLTLRFGCGLGNDILESVVLRSVSFFDVACCRVG